MAVKKEAVIEKDKRPYVNESMGRGYKGAVSPDYPVEITPGNVLELPIDDMGREFRRMHSSEQAETLSNGHIDVIS